MNVNEVKKVLNGPIASVSTPFNKDGSIDYSGLCNYVNFVIDGGSPVVLLTYGDSLYSILSDNEIAKITEAVVRQVRKRVVVIAATGRWWTGQCVEFADYSRNLGVDILMSLPPDWAQFNNNNELIEHYKSIASKIPVMLVTSMGSRALPIPVISELIQKETRIVAVKDDVCGKYGRKIAGVINEKIAILSGGLKENYLDIMPYKVNGYISVYIRFKPEIAHNFWNAVNNHDINEAVRIIQKYEQPFIEELSQKTGLDNDAVIHASMEIYGVCKRWRRMPYKNANENQMEIIRDFISQFDSI